jgi:hypothetical protein
MVGGGRKKRNGLRITDRDLQIVGWVGRQRFASAEQIRGRFGMDLSRSYRRLRATAAAGLVEHRQVFHGPGVYLATERGLGAVDLPLPQAKVDVRTYHHDLALAGLCAGYELAGSDVVTEREIRAADAFATEPRFAIQLGDRRLHLPDLIVSDDQGLVAVELERTAKRAIRLDRILGAYLRARHLTGVRYHAASPRLESWLRQAVERVHAEDFIEVVGPDIQTQNTKPSPTAIGVTK